MRITTARDGSRRQGLWPYVADLAMEKTATTATTALPSWSLREKREKSHRREVSDVEVDIKRRQKAVAAVAAVFSPMISST